MGTGGASSGIAKNGRPYGTEFTEILKSGNIKFVKYRDNKSGKSPMETMTKGHVYVTVNNKNELSNIIYFDKDNKRYKQVDFDTHSHEVDGVKMLIHTHKGYIHSEKGTFKLSQKELKMVERVKSIWYNHNK